MMICGWMTAGNNRDRIWYVQDVSVEAVRSKAKLITHTHAYQGCSVCFFGSSKARECSRTLKLSVQSNVQIRKGSFFAGFCVILV